MTPLSKIFHRRSITFAVLALLVSVVALVHAFGFSMRSRPPSSFFALRFIIASVVAFAVCIKATVNLIRDVERGYSRARCSLAAVLVLLAFAISTWAGLGLVSLLLR
jgi:hypothetical protein